MRVQTGKIARLPKRIRDEIITRLDNGERARVILDWLNSDDSVKGILASQFCGRPISDNNLSEWRKNAPRSNSKSEKTLDLKWQEMIEMVTSFTIALRPLLRVLSEFGLLSRRAVARVNSRTAQRTKTQMAKINALQNLSGSLALKQSMHEHQDTNQR